LFLEGYAFERQGRRPDYSHAAVDSIIKAKNNEGTLNRKHVSAVWKYFKDYLDTIGLNEANNPLCPKGTYYDVKIKGKTVSRTTKKILFWNFYYAIQRMGYHLILLCMRKLGLKVKN
jgi:hypothetical protein